MSALESDVLVPALPTDILILILEEFVRMKEGEGSYRACGHELLSLRLLSRQMNDLVVPISFRRVTLNDGILESFKTYIKTEPKMPFEYPHHPAVSSYSPEIIRAQRKVAEYICTYVQHVSVINIELDWARVPDFLHSLKKLKHITWSFWGPSYYIHHQIYHYMNAPVQYAVLACPKFRARWPKLRISVENFHRDEAMEFWPLLVDVMSGTDANVEANVERPNTDIASNVFAMQLKKLLLASPQMEVCDLTYDSKEDVTVGWKIKDGEKLPPFTDLRLSCIRWDFSPVEAVEFWDWSRMTYLKMTKVPIIPFLKTVAPKYLSGLRTFETDCHGSEKNIEEASKLLCDLVERIVTLEGLAIRCSIKNHLDRCLPTIIKHGCNIRWRTLRDLHSPRGDPTAHAVIPLKNLTALRSACSNLTRLEIDVKLSLLGLEKTGHILTTTLASFRNLRKLSLHTRMQYPTPMYDRLWSYLGVVEEMVRPWIEELAYLKAGVELESLSLRFNLIGAFAFASDCMEVEASSYEYAVGYVFILVYGMTIGSW